MTLRIFHETDTGVQETLAQWDRKDDLGEWMRTYSTLVQARYGSRFAPHYALVTAKAGKIMDTWDARIAA